MPPVVIGCGTPRLGKWQDVALLQSSVGRPHVPAMRVYLTDGRVHAFSGWNVTKELLLAWHDPHCPHRPICCSSAPSHL
jgi:hypothetical protein